MAQNCKTTDAINLKSYNFSESDKLILMYSKENGLIKGLAKGCKKPKSKLGARMDLLVANSLLIANGRNINTICEAKSINTFKNSRQNIDKLMYSSYISEIVVNFGVENDPYSEAIYNLLYKALDKISNSNNKTEMLITVIKFQLKFMHITGLGIELKQCLNCQKDLDKEDGYFFPQRGGVVCKNCADETTIRLQYKLREFLIQTEETDFDKISDYELKANEKVCIACFNMLKKYVQLHCPKKFKSIDIFENPCTELLNIAS